MIILKQKNIIVLALIVSLVLFVSLPFLTFAQGEIDDLQIQKDEKRKQLLEINYMRRHEKSFLHIINMRKQLFACL